MNECQLDYNVLQYKIYDQRISSQNLIYVCNYIQTIQKHSHVAFTL